MVVGDYNAVFRKIENQSSTVRLFTVDLDSNMEFKAGQFANLSFELDGHSYIKPYSIASSPYFKNSIQFSIKLVENGRATPKLWNLTEGAEVRIKGPLGVFGVRGEKEKLVFIGTGTGVAPLRSMIQDEIFNKQTQKEILLIFGVRHEEDILFREEFEKLEVENPNFKFIKIVSRPNDSWLGRIGHVQDNFDLIDPLNSEFYICGLPLMFEGAKQKLLEMGVDGKSIFHEVFR